MDELVGMYDMICELLTRFEDGEVDGDQLYAPLCDVANAIAKQIN